ncbi:MAG TPA: cytochrome P450 [Stellaceae bacterium]|nr:cytochrome P450 [Stellaceae bacterium]
MRLSWRAVTGALRGNALAAFPAAAFEQEVVVQQFFGRRMVIDNRPPAIRHVLIENAQNYARGTATARVLRPLFGRGLFFSSGDEWRRQRRDAAHGFNPRAVAQLAGQTAAAAHGLVEALEPRTAEPLDLIPVLRRLALGIIGQTMFSLDMRRYGATLQMLIMDYAARLGRPTLADFLLPASVPSPADIARYRFRRHWRALIDAIVEDRRQREREIGRHDLFDVLSGPQDAPADRDELADQVATVVVAGHDTTASALFWALYLLARDPEAQERAAEEAAGVDLDPDRAAESLSRLTWVRAVVDEALRLYPPSFVIVRQALGDDRVEGLAVPAGSMILISPWVLHRHRALWDEPERFIPSRFLPGAPTPERFAYLPFGVGPRTCIGAAFALTELVLVLAILVRAFRVELAAERVAVPTATVTIQPGTPPAFRLRSRA